MSKGLSKERVKMLAKNADPVEIIVQQIKARGAFVRDYADATIIVRPEEIAGSPCGKAQRVSCGVNEAMLAFAEFVHGQACQTVDNKGFLALTLGDLAQMFAWQNEGLRDPTDPNS